MACVPRQPCFQTPWAAAQRAALSLNYSVRAVIWGWGQRHRRPPQTGQQAAVTVVLTCLSFSRALNSFPGETLWPVGPSPSSCLLHGLTPGGPGPLCPPCPGQTPLDSHNKTWVNPGPDCCHKHVRMCVHVCPHARPLTHTSRLGQTIPQLPWPHVWLSPQQGGSPGPASALAQFPLWSPVPSQAWAAGSAWLPSRKVARPSLLLSLNPDGRA